MVMNVDAKRRASLFWQTYRPLIMVPDMRYT
jgi:hypothetical protein